MRPWTIRQLLLLSLAALVALAIANSAVASSAMSVKMTEATAMSADMPAIDCQPGPPHPGENRMDSCALACISSSLALPSPPAIDEPPSVAQNRIPTSSGTAIGIAPSPILPPPRTLDIA
jgi:hypothetical protein